MSNFQEIYDLQIKYNQQVVAKYDMINGLTPLLYRIDGFSYIGSSPHGLRIALKPLDSNYDSDADIIMVQEHCVLTYDQILDICNNTKKVFEHSKEFFIGVLRQSIAPMKRDLEVLEFLVGEFRGRGLIIEEDQAVCAATKE